MIEAVTAVTAAAGGYGPDRGGYGGGRSKPFSKGGGGYGGGGGGGYGERGGERVAVCVATGVQVATVEVQVAINTHF